VCHALHADETEGLTLLLLELSIACMIRAALGLILEEFSSINRLSDARLAKFHRARLVIKLPGKLVELPAQCAEFASAKNSRTVFGCTFRSAFIMRSTTPLKHLLGFEIHRRLRQSRIVPTQQCGAKQMQSACGAGQQGADDRSAESSPDKPANR